MKRHIKHIHEGINYACHLCEKAYTDKRNLNNHILSVHKKIKNHTCHECGKSFAFPSNLKVHMKKFHKIEEFFSQEGNNNKDKKEIMESFMDTNDDTMVSVHEGIKKFSCHLCEKSFTDKTNMKRHIICVHEGIKQFSCHLCEKAFTKKVSMKRHISSVHEGIKIVCHLCKKSFGRKYELKAHVLRIHKKIKNHICHECEKSFALSHDLKVHVKKVHKIEEFFGQEEVNNQSWDYLYLLNRT